MNLDTLVDDVLPYSIPRTFRNSSMGDDHYITNLLEPFTNSNTTQCNTSQCYFTSTTPESLDWTNAYKEDNDTKFVLSKLLDSKCND